MKKISKTLELLKKKHFQTIWSNLRFFKSINLAKSGTLRYGWTLCKMIFCLYVLDKLVIALNQL